MTLPIKPNDVIEVAKALVPSKRNADKLMTIVIGLTPDVYLRGVEAQAKEIKILQEANVETNSLDIRRRINELEKEFRLLKIAKKAEEHLDDNADPEKIDPDWRLKFLSNAANVSTEDMQEMWSRLLACLIHCPSTISKQTLNVVADMGRQDAELFAHCCKFSWTNVGTQHRSLIIHKNDQHKRLVRFTDRTILESLGLIRNEDYGWFPENLTMLVYHGPYKIKFICKESAKEEPTKIDLGSVCFTRTGEELVNIVDPDPDYNYAETCIEYWKSRANTDGYQLEILST